MKFFRFLLKYPCSFEFTAVRCFDILIAVIMLPVFLLFYFVFLILYLPLRIDPLFSQVRIGKYGRKFVLYKFRTMSYSTPDLPSHLCSSSYFLPGARFVRFLKLDELPQCLNILSGKMSLVGPRPNLPSQADITSARLACGIYSIPPGITGYAQVAGVDMSDIALLLKYDCVQLQYSRDLLFYVRILFSTFFGNAFRDSVLR